MPQATIFQPAAQADPPPSAGSSLIGALLRHARERPGAEAVVEMDGSRERWTYGELALRVASRARRLRACAAPGSVVVALLPSGTEYVAWFCAAIAAGMRLMPMHTQIAPSEARAAADRAGAAAAIAAPDIPATSALGHLTSIRADRSHEDDAEMPRGEPGGVVLGSSGTTGLPKLVLRDGASLDADAAGVIHGMGLTPADRIAFATPLSHSYGVDVLLGALTAGATLLTSAGFDADAVAAELNAGATVLPAVPFILEALARRAPAASTRPRLVLSAGSSLPPRVRREFVGAWGVEPGQLYGATELGTVAMSLPGSDDFDPACIGRPMPGVSVRVVDVDDPSRTLGTDAQGHLAVRAPSMLSAYLDGEVPTVDGHFLTGDLARIDPQGRIWISGRLKMLIDVGAYKVNPLEVESVLADHPAVAECVVVPLTASETVQRLRAMVVPRDAARPPSSRQLRAFLSERLSAVKVPRVIDIVGSLPRSPAGKVIRVWA